MSNDADWPTIRRSSASPQAHASPPPPSAALTPSSSHQARLLEETQNVVLELRDDICRLQAENAQLRRQSSQHDAAERLTELQLAFDQAVEKHKRDVKEARFKNLRLQQERQKLLQHLSEAEAELVSRPRAAAAGAAEEAAGKAELLEAAVDELRKENAALREEKLSFMTCELKRLHPKDDKTDAETELERVNFALDSAVTDLSATTQKVKELSQLNEAQEELLERRTVEYESLLESRRAEVDTMNVLSASLSETQELYDQAQREIVRLQEEARDHASERMVEEAKREREETKRVEAAQSCQSQDGKTAEEWKQELSVVRKTAGEAIETLSASLKKSLMVRQTLCAEFEQSRVEMKDEYERSQQRIAELEAENARLTTMGAQLQAKEDELQSFKKQMEEQAQRTKEAKQRLKAEILDTKELIKNQQREVQEDLNDDDDFLSLLNIPNRAREILNSPAALVREASPVSVVDAAASAAAAAALGMPERD